MTADDDPPRRTYGYKDIQRLLMEHLGVNVDLGTLRTAPHHTSQQTYRPVRITAGMPAPIGPRGRRRLFDADQIDAWIQSHPRRAHDQARLDLAAAATALPSPGIPRDYQTIGPAVHRAHDAGLSWAQIAETLTAATGIPWRAQGLHRYLGQSHRP